jgi:hypothetical protein
MGLACSRPSLDTAVLHEDVPVDGWYKSCLQQNLRAAKYEHVHGVVVVDGCTVRDLSLELKLGGRSMRMMISVLFECRPVGWPATRGARRVHHCPHWHAQLHPAGARHPTHSHPIIGKLSTCLLLACQQLHASCPHRAACTPQHARSLLVAPSAAARNKHCSTPRRWRWRSTAGMPQPLATFS